MIYKKNKMVKNARRWQREAKWAIKLSCQGSLGSWSPQHQCRRAWKGLYEQESSDTVPESEKPHQLIGQLEAGARGAAPVLTGRLENGSSDVGGRSWPSQLPQKERTPSLPLSVGRTMPTCPGRVFTQRRTPQKQLTDTPGNRVFSALWASPSQ